MKKIQPTNIENETTADTFSKARIAFDDYKRKMDECFAKETANRQKFIPMPPPYPGFPPAYSYTPSQEQFYGSRVDLTDDETQSTQKHEEKEHSILDSLERLLELSIKTINTTLTGSAAVMNRFYGMDEKERCQESESYGFCCERECDCDCECYSQHYEPCCRCECHPSVGNCMHK
jgi:hypothetical protein